MARHGRYFVSDQPLHVIQRGNNREPIFFTGEDYTRYRNWLIKAAAATLGHWRVGADNIFTGLAGTILICRGRRKKTGTFPGVLIWTVE